MRVVASRIKAKSTFGSQRACVGSSLVGSTLIAALNRQRLDATSFPKQIICPLDD